jgi:nucleoside-diphosphate-sugar epimerase
MKILVTGGGGWVVRYCVAALSGAGHEVVSLSRTHGESLPGVTQITADLLDPQGLADALGGLGLDRVVHLAGETGRGGAAAELREFWEGNVLGTRNLIDALDASCGGVLIASSAAVYGSAGVHGRRTDERVCPAPVSWYGVSKAAQERVGEIAGRSRGIRVAIVRIFNLIGPDGPPRTVAHDLALRLVRQHRAGEPLVVESPETVRDFVDVRDVTEAIRMLLAQLPGPEQASIWNLCSGRETGVEELAELIRSEIPGADRLVFRARPLAAGNVAYQVGDPAAVRRDTGWVARRETAESVGDLVAQVMRTTGDAR